MRRAPAVIGGLDDRVDAHHQRRDDQAGTRQVGPFGDADATVALQVAQGERAGDDRDRQVDDEDPVPIDRLGDRAAGEQADRAARGGDERVDADRFRLLPGLGEHGDDHPEDDGGGEGAADALDEARDDQDRLAVGEAAGE